MKQFTFLLLCVLIIFVFSACITTENGSGSKVNSDKDTNTTTNTNTDNEGKSPSGIYDITTDGIRIGTNLGMKIISVKESRCPTNTNCFVAGEAKVIVQVTKGGTASEIILKAKGLCEGDDGKCGNTVTTSGIKIQLLNVYPYPGENAKIEQDAYSAKVRID